MTVSDTAKLSSLMLTLAEKGIISGEEASRIKAVDQLVKLLIDKGIIEAETYEKRSLEVTEIIDEVVGLMKNRNLNSRSLNTLRTKFGQSYRILFGYLEKIAA